MSTATVEKPKGTAPKPKGTAPKPKTKTVPSTAGRTVNKRTITEYREFLIKKKADILQQMAVRVGKLDAKIADIDRKHADRVAAADALKAAKAEGKTAKQLDDEFAAEIKALQAKKRMLKKV